MKKIYLKSVSDFLSDKQMKSVVGGGYYPDYLMCAVCDRPLNIPIVRPSPGCTLENWFNENGCLPGETAISHCFTCGYLYSLGYI